MSYHLIDVVGRLRTNKPHVVDDDDVVACRYETAGLRPADDEGGRWIANIINILYSENEGINWEVYFLRKYTVLHFTDSIAIALIT